MNRLLIACAVLGLAACAQLEDANGDGIADGVRKPDSVSVVAPSTPVGTLSGAVTTTTFAPLDGVQVTLILGSGADASRVRTTTTNAQGAFVFNNVPAGSNGQLLLSKTGYSQARVNINVPGSAGNIPLNDGNGNAGVIALVELTGDVRLRVYTAQGAIARGARAFLEVNPTAFQSVSGAYGAGVGNFSATAEVDDNGVLAFSGAPNVAEMARVSPNTQYTVTIGALDLDNDGRPEFLGSIQQFSASALFTNPARTVLLPDARVNAPLAITATNLESFSTAFSPPYRNSLSATEPITIVFNQPITSVEPTRLVRVVAEDCATNVPVSVAQRAPNTLSIAPTTSWTLGNRYNVVVRATGLDSGTTTDFIGYFFAIDPGSPQQVSNVATFQVRKAAGNTMTNAYEPGDSLNVIFSTPITRQAGVAYAYVNFDLNGDNTIGGMTGAGEFGGPANSGFPIFINEQQQATDPNAGTFFCKQSGYSSRWSINVNRFPPSGNIPNLTQMRVIFPRDNQSSATFQTAWGGPVAIDVNGSIGVQ
jgi:hypothetical protein